MKNQEGEDVELLKAVAQAWHAQAGNPRPTNEFDARRSGFRHRPSRFRLEAINSNGDRGWDFAQSLWDSYEIVTLSKKLEASLAVDDPVAAALARSGKRRRESRNSLRNLFCRVSSKRLDGDIPVGDGDGTL